MNRKVLLVFSIGINIGLLWLISAFWSNPITAELASTTDNGQIRRTRLVLPQSASVTNTIDIPFHWSQIESEDYFIYLKNLKAIACPDQTIRDIITADVNDYFAQKRLAIVTEPVSRFWEYIADSEEMEKMVKAKGKELDQWNESREEMLEKLLGTKERKRSVYTPDQIGGRLGFLPEAKRVPVLGLIEKFGTLWQAAENPTTTNTFRLKPTHGEVNASFISELSNRLTPAELEEYELQLSPSAHQLRRRLEGFAPTESEFRQIYALQKSMDEKDGRYSYAPISDSGPARTAHLEVDKAFSSILNLDRRKDFSRARSSDFRKVYAFTERMGLPRSKAAELDAISQEIKKVTDGIMKDLSITEDERTAQLEKVATTHIESIVRAVGQSNFSVYEENQF